MINRDHTHAEGLHGHREELTYHLIVEHDYQDRPLPPLISTLVTLHDRDHGRGSSAQGVFQPIEMDTTWTAGSFDPADPLARRAGGPEALRRALEVAHEHKDDGPPVWPSAGPAGYDSSGFQMAAARLADYPTMTGTMGASPAFLADAFPEPPKKRQRILRWAKELFKR